MRKLVAATGFFIAGCLKSNTTPSPPAFDGGYTLAVEASSVCRLPVSRFQWDVEATSSSSGGQDSTQTQTRTVRATLPGGDNAVDVSLVVSPSLAGSSEFTAIGSISTRSVGFGTQPLSASIGGGGQGSASVGTGGRGQIQDAFLNGTITLANAADKAIVGSCTAANHKWTLIAR